MFLAIINDTYSEVKEEVEHRKEDFQVVDMISRGYNNVREMVHTRDKLIDIQASKIVIDIVYTVIHLLVVDVACVLFWTQSACMITKHNS